MGDTLALQSTLAVVMLIITAIAGFTPFIILRMMQKRRAPEESSGFLSYLSCFSGGVFLATCFLDVVPHINEGYAELLEKYELGWHFPFPQFVTCCGFFFIYFIEEFTTYVFGGRSSGHGHAHHVDAPPKRKESVNITNLVVEETSGWVVSDEKSSWLKSITFAIAMSFHSLLEGFALGVQDSAQGIYSLFFSLLLHKGVEAFSVGLHLNISHANSNKRKTILATIFVYCLMTPIGIIIGSNLQNSDTTNVYKDCFILFLESLAAGTFIYVTFIEIMATEKSNEFNHLNQLLSIITGFALITAMQAIFGHGHEHGDHHHHEHDHHVHHEPATALLNATNQLH